MHNFEKKSVADGWNLFVKLLKQPRRRRGRKKGKGAKAAVKGYVNDLVKSSIRDMQAYKLAEPAYEVFETHRTVYVRVRLPESANPERIAIRADRHRVRISGIAEMERLHVRTPAPVFKKKGNAVVKNNVLEIVLRKRPQPAQDKEVPVPIR